MSSAARGAVSVVIPSGNAARQRNLADLQGDLARQTRAPMEVIVIRGVAPNGRARNAGVERCSGDVLCFVDDDVRLGADNVIEELVRVLESDPSVGLVGTAQQIPPESSAFQRRCARELSRASSPVVADVTESDMVTTQCCAIRAADLAALGGFDGRIPRGVDPDLRRRVRESGLRVVIAPGVWHYHPMPGSAVALARMAWRDGAASACARRFYPETVVFNPEGHSVASRAHRSLAERAVTRAVRLLGDAAALRWTGLLYGSVYGVAAMFPRLIETPAGGSLQAAPGRPG